jgi:hypothetical protein
MAFFIASRASATTCPADIGICAEREEVEAACRTVFGSLRAVFRGAGLGSPFSRLSTIGRPVDCVAAPSGGPEGRSISMASVARIWVEVVLRTAGWQSMFQIFNREKSQRPVTARPDREGECEDRRLIADDVPSIDTSCIAVCRLSLHQRAHAFSDAPSLKVKVKVAISRSVTDCRSLQN